MGLTACKDAPQQPGGAQYKTLTLAPTDRTLTRQYTATVEGRQSVEIRPQVDGTITEVCIDEGAPVRKGQILFVIDQVPYRAALQTAEANVKSAEASIATARQSLLSAQLTAVQDKYDEAQSVIGLYHALGGGND